MVLLARKDEEGNTQALYDHLHGAGRLASGFEDEFADISRTAAVLHDVGKVAQQFQTYLLSDDGHRGDVQHARQGAFVVNDFFESKGEIEEIAKEILELAISKHHGGLPDCIDESGNRAFLLGFTESDKSNEKYAYQEIKRGLNGLALDLQSNFRGSAEDIACFLKKIKSLRLSKDSIYFYLGLLVKLIYSRLVDADRTDAACFETRKQYRPNAVDWQNLISRLDKSMRSFDSSSEINRIRHQINEQCCLAGARETGIYRLSIPTGGGKTLASLNFALHHALKTGKRRIIYVIPYLSITTQTAKTFRDVLGLNSDSDVLLEHYSTAGMQRSADVADNASSEFEDAGEHQRKLAAERWDNPIIVTTMVEFLETVMSARGTKLRKFHNMADSVIIFDEIQSLPMNTINLFNEIVSFLSKITNSTILLCSATQPLLEKTKRENLLLSEKPDLIAETESYEDKLRRTRIVASAENKSCDELGQIIYQQARKNGNCLAIVNLKKEAREIFQCLERLDVNHEFELIHLSTAMCGRHRTDCLNRIGALLDPGNPKPVICVSTQLIEAGVDISFACVVRAMAGLDSIMQAAGRCNRNGESVEPKNVYVYPLKDEDSMERYLPDIAMGKQLTLQIMENYPGKDLLSSNILEQYYDMLLRKKDGKAGVCFEVQIGLEDSDLSNDVDIRNRWIAYLQRSQHRLGKDVFGEDLYTPTTNFPKKVVSSDANAKLLSANDSTNFTFRGRFSSKEQALLVDSASSQKINSTLRWLVNNHGTLTGNQAIVVWAIKRPEEKPVLNPQSGSFDFDDSFSSIADESKALHDDISDALNATNVQYAKIFSRVLRGYEGAEDLKKHNDPMVVVILDAATTGRLGVTFYCELQKDEYIKRILQWHVDAAWPLTSFKKSIVEGAERVNVVQYEGAPSFTDIINCACDTSDRSSKSYKRFAKDVKERLIECMFGGAQFPMSILNAACHKVTRPMGYDNIRVWRRDFEIACSLWKKHYIDETRKQHRQEDVITMYLEPNRDDRDYLYGRLLALADNFEESVLRKQGVKDRPTNAIKLMSNFTAKPYTTWGTLWKQLTPYLKSANGGSWFRNEVDDVMALFKEGDFEDNKALSPMFLLGYSCQRRASRRKAQEISQKNNSNN